MIDNDVKFTVADVDQKMSTFLQDQFSLLLRDLNKDTYESIKLDKVQWDLLVANPEQWEDFKFKPPEKDKN